MRVYVLNLARAALRRRDIERSAARVGVSLDFVDAVDGRQIDDVDRAMVDHAGRRKVTRFLLSDGEIGCWLSHRRALRALIDSGEPMAAILEDDVTLLDRFPDTLRAIESSSDRFDVVTLHRNKIRREVFVACRNLAPDLQLGRIGYIQTGNLGYVISRAGAEKFLAFRPKFIHAIDKELHRYWANGLDIYAVSTPVVLHDDSGHSYLDETRMNHRPQRPHYPDADQLYWRVQRLKSKTIDSVQKRLAFPAYVMAGRGASAGGALT